MTSNSDAAELIRVHGMRASQIVIDRMVAAVRAGDQAEIAALDQMMRELDGLREAARFQPRD